MNRLEFETRAIHDDFLQGQSIKATQVPVYESASFSYDDAESIADVFSGKRFGYIYSRISNPTVTALERRLSNLENGIGAVAVSSGMAAIATAIFALTKSGDRIIAAKGLFSGTYYLFQELFQKYGVETTYVDIDDLDSLRNSIDNRTRLIFVESIGNPGMKIPDIQALSHIARESNVPLIVDSTLTTPYLLKSKEYGVDIIIHSLTKYLTGNGSTIGGAIIDTGNYDWGQSFSGNVKEISQKAGQYAFLGVARKQVLQYTGSCLSPANARQHILGLETLHLRMERHCLNGIKLAEYLSHNDKVRNVNYPGLKDNPYHSIANKQFSNKHGGVLTMSLKSQEKCFKFISKLSLVKNQANIGDARTLIIHPASTIFHEYSKNELQDLGIDDSCIRISAGLENIKDIINDFDQALKEV